MGILDIFKKDKKRNKPDKLRKREKLVSPKKEKSKIAKDDLVKKEKKVIASPAKKVIRKSVKKGSVFASNILIKPMITERATDLGIRNQYVFAVAPEANRTEIKKAIQATYGVDPIKVNIINMGGKNIRYGRSEGSTKSWKKAIIFLREGDKIELYEGV